MSSLELLCNFMNIDTKKLSKEENFILEAELYTRVFSELWGDYKRQYKDYFYLIKLNIQMENLIMESHIIRFLINDILKNEAYTLPGIAHYTQTPEEIIQELFIGHKTSPAISFARKLIELHKLIRPDIYKNIIKKITLDEEDDKEK